MKRKKEMRCSEYRMEERRRAEGSGKVLEIYEGEMGRVDSVMKGVTRRPTGRIAMFLYVHRVKTGWTAGSMPSRGSLSAVGAR